ncbi:MAG TPA: polysaccharide biosynthesis tyrosine autokinase [Verrucomicrobiae bacterium]|jgi:capsular exopolysaccharide synthesis family protein|nr:polysaccharide biosynthesis tyrosine autokinase [Verrucomicrobiae bacterium]
MTELLTHGEVHLQDYLYILRKRAFVIFATFALIVCAGVYLTFRAQILYKATTTIMIEKENPNVVDFKEVMAFDSSSTDYYQTQYQMLKSRSLLEELIEVERLDEDPYLRGMRKGGLKKLIKRQKFLAGLLGPFLQERSLSSLIDKRIISVDPVRNSRLVYVSMTHPDPKKAARMANSLVNLFIKRNLENRFYISKQATELLSGQLEELKVKVSLAEKNLQTYKEKHELINIPSIREKDDFLQEARLELVKMQAEQARIATRYLPAHPKYINIKSQIDALKGKIEEEEAKKLSLGAVAIDYAQLEREADSARQIYETLLSRFQEMHSEAKTQASNVMVVDMAQPPERPFKPRPFLNLMIAVLSGIFFGIILAFFFEYLDATIKVPDDIEKGLGLELFGIIPKSAKDKNGPLGGEIFLSTGKPSQATEAFRALRTTLLFKLRHITGCRVIVVTSPNPSEGKSTVSLNLAAAFEQNHLKGLLIDSDLRKPKLHSRIGVAHDSGLTDILEGKVKPDDVIQKNVQGVGFDFLTSGTHSNRPTELLGGRSMAAFIEDMKKQYDVIIIDSPPFLAVADVAVLSEYMDSMIVVTKYQQTEKRHLKEIKRRFAELRNKIVGVVINQVSVQERDYYYHQYYYYGYGDAAKK